jgi:hypothetical protein
LSVRQARRLIAPLALAAVALKALGFALSIQSARAQAGDDIYVDKQLGRADPVVPTPTPTPVAPLLPETGNAGRGVGRSLAAVLLILGASVALLVRARR